MPQCPKCNKFLSSMDIERIQDGDLECSFSRCPAEGGSGGKFLLSAAVGAATGSAILGGLIGGDIVGGIVGDLLDGDLMD